jgi:hypothetical protein
MLALYMGKRLKELLSNVLRWEGLMGALFLYSLQLLFGGKLCTFFRVQKVLIAFVYVFRVRKKRPDFSGLALKITGFNKGAQVSPVEKILV